MAEATSGPREGVFAVTSKPWHVLQIRAIVAAVLDPRPQIHDVGPVCGDGVARRNALLQRALRDHIEPPTRGASNEVREKRMRHRKGRVRTP